MTPRAPRSRRFSIPSLLLVMVLSGLAVTATSVAVQKPLVAKAANPPATGWATVSSANTSATHSNYLYSTSCVTSTNCWAVGYACQGTSACSNGTGVSYQTLIEQYNGTSWSTVTSANTSTALSNFLYGVSCVTASNCWASGFAYNGSGKLQTLIEHYSGTSWSIATSPNTSSTLHNELFTVTCTSASDCWTEGAAYNAGGYYQPLTIHYDGTSWSIVTSATKSTTQTQYLTGVACTSSSDCWVAGYYVGTTYDQTLIEHWNGTAWSIVTSANTSSSQSNILENVACVSASLCWAIGYYAGTTIQTLVEQYNGSSWSVVTSPNATAYTNELLDATCVSANDCMAVGISCPSSTCNGGSGTSYQTEVAHWDGTSWSLDAPTNATATNHNELTGVTCVAGASPDNCLAVGYYCEGSTSTCTGGTNTSAQTLSEQYGGPVQNKPISSAEWAAAAAVGDTSASSPDAPSAIQGSVNTESGGLYAPRTDIAVPGRGFGLSVTRSNNSAPSAPSGADAFNQTTCTSSSNCWGVGNYCGAVGGIPSCANGSYAQNLIERYDGTSWKTVPSPNSGSSDNVLYDVNCVTSSDCWTVGYYQGSGGAHQTLTEAP